MNIKKYIVGGWVRDKLLGLKPRDRDWVIVGASEQDIEYLKSIGYSTIGKDFPVFMSPDGEEYALARTERKNGTGYTGFECNTNKVTIQEDLSRRDLTINAVAYDPVLEIYIDPHKGREDIKNKVLRHTSSAFSEDPLRVLRLARFAARYSDFTIHSSTDTLARKLVKDGKLKELSTDRVMMEFHKAFSDENSAHFIKILNDYGFIEQFFGKSISESEMKTISTISKNGTPAYVEDFVLSIIMEGKTFDKNHKYNSIPFKESTTSFIKFKDKMKELKRFTKLTPTEITQWFSTSSVHNKGAEQFMYKCTEFLLLCQELQIEQEEYIIKMYDSYYDAVIPDIKEMIKKGELQNSETKEYVFNLHLQEIQKRF